MTGVNPFRKGREGDDGPAAGARPRPDQAPVPADPTALPPEPDTDAAKERGRVASLAAELTAAGRAVKDARALRRGRGVATRPAQSETEEAERRHRSVRVGLGALADRIAETAPRVPIRDLATLRRQFPGSRPEHLADRLVAVATRGTATVGAGVGAAAMLPTPPAMPAELAAEVVGVAALEIKLIAELHEVYGLRPPGTLRQRGMAYLQCWTQGRGVEITRPVTLNAALGSRTKRELRQQILKRTFRNVPSLAPFMVGAAVGAMMNRRDTYRLAERIRADLRRQVPWAALPETTTGPLPPDAPDGTAPGAPS